MTLSIIACIGENRAMGIKNSLLWHLPDDLKHFKQITLGHTVIMGMTTYKSIGKPLPRRENIVLTRQKGIELPGCLVVNSLDQALEIVKDRAEVFVIGGASVYQQFLPKVSTLYITLVKDSPTADTYFPKFAKDFKLISSVPHSQDAKHKFEFSFRILLFQNPRGI
ncbi:MAG: dihydrofolate reductase [Patescibacteria group bacterium]